MESLAYFIKIFFYLVGNPNVIWSFEKVSHQGSDYIWPLQILAKGLDLMLCKVYLSH